MTRYLLFLLLAGCMTQPCTPKIVTLDVIRGDPFREFNLALVDGYRSLDWVCNDQPIPFGTRYVCTEPC